MGDMIISDANEKVRFISFGLAYKSDIEASKGGMNGAIVISWK